ncbi:hypothetical protein P5673_008594 [Acropora cervicornis]|uniref:Uncharacterized protein n=1 Tax=Acropora cervicornis TaxID=6130 RepID=A0AAD9QUN3_ACRCE|nr:hypothetical protein P5673_008594 [Acropora cervicornis]
MVSYGQRAFSYAGPELWNILPEHIKNSKSTIINVDGIFHGKISSPSEASGGPDFLDEAPHAALVALPILKAFAVAPE